MTFRRTLLLLLPATVSCSDDPCPQGSSRAADGLCYLMGGDSGAADGSDGTVTDGDGTDGGDGADGSDGTVEFTMGDPIEQAFRQGSESSTGPDGLVEWVDVAMIDGQYGIAVGQGGWQVVDVLSGEQVYRKNSMRGYRVDSDGTLAAITMRQGQVLRVDVSDPTFPQEIAPVFMGGEAANEDVSVYDGHMIVGWTTQGAILYDDFGTQQAVIPADHAFGVGLHGDRAIVTDGAEVSLWDVSTFASPVELDRAPLTGEGRDVDFDGARLAVGLGGFGVDVFDVVDDALVLQGNVGMPGSALSVSLDGDYLWAATWETVALAYVGGSEPAVLGHQDVSQSAFGVAARDGRALVADWFFATGLQQNPGVAGPELVMDETFFFPTPGEPTVVPVGNSGYFDLEVAFDVPPEFTMEPSELTLEPGASANVLVTPPADLDRERTDVNVATNDPDEEALQIKLQLPTADIGSYHDPLELQGFQLPDTALDTYALHDQRGKVVLLAYWALF